MATYEKLVCFWYDQYIHWLLNAYYWPYFVAGDVSKTSNICQK